MASPTRFIDYAAIAPAVQLLLGQFVLHRQVEDSTSHIFILLLGPSPATTHPAETSALNVHCAWRTVEAGKILCSWQEAIERYTEPALQTLVGLQITSVALSEFGDLTLGFASGRALHIWNDAPYAEGDSWLLSLPGQGEYAVATHNEFTHRPTNLHTGISSLLAARHGLRNG